MSKKQDLTEAEIDQLRSMLEWWSQHQTMTYKQIKFDHTDSRICSVRLGKKFYEEADLFARSRPEYRSFSRMVEILIWERLNKPQEYLRQLTTETDSGLETD